jgi:hypothetical protein
LTKRTADEAADRADSNTRDSPDPLFPGPSVDAGGERQRGKEETGKSYSSAIPPPSPRRHRQENKAAQIERQERKTEAQIQVLNVATHTLNIAHLRQQKKRYITAWIQQDFFMSDAFTCIRKPTRYTHY